VPYRFEAVLDNGTRITSQRYGEGWSHDEAWAHFMCEAWSRARKADCKTAIVGDQYSFWGLKYKVYEPLSGSRFGALRGAEPGIFSLETGLPLFRRLSWLDVLGVRLSRKVN